MRCLLVLTMLIILEMFIFPAYNFRDNYKILSKTTIHFLGILNSVYSTRNTLKKYSRWLPISIIAINYFFGKFLISRFYDSGCKYFEAMHSLVIIFVTAIPFCFCISKEELDEFEQKGGSIKYYIHSAISNIIAVNQLFYFYKHFHLKHGNIIEYNFNRQLIVHFIVDFLANSFSYSINNILCYFLSTKEKRRNIKYLKNIFRRFFLMVMANVAFYSIYSFQMARGVFEFSFEKISPPHNLILYNLLPKDLDQRFRLFLYIFNWLIAM